MGAARNGPLIVDNAAAAAQTGVAVIVSPHLDDAVFSCGLTLQALDAGGWSVIALTVFSDAPAGPVSEIAERFNLSGGSTASEGLANRRAEDTLALARLGAKAVHLGFYDASLRKRPGGEWVCGSYQDVRRLTPQAEPELRERIEDTLAHELRSTGPSLVLGPAGMGSHVDHRIVGDALNGALTRVNDRCAVYQYEDLPYAFGRQDNRVSPFSSGTREHMETKLEAMALYRSQLRFLPGDDEAADWRLHFASHARDPATEKYVERAEPHEPARRRRSAV